MTIEEFQHDGLTWDELSAKNELAAVLDPSGSIRKNSYIHSIHVQTLKSAMRSFKKGRVLDFGCGTGRISRWMASNGWDVTGVDISSGMLAKAKELTPDSMPVCFQEFDGIHIPSNSNGFEAVITVYVLQYAIKNRDLLVSIAKEFLRVLKPGGRLFCIEITDEHSSSRTKYAEIMTFSGFSLIYQRPVRKQYDIFMSLAQSKLVPKKIIPVLAYFGILLCRWRFRHDTIPIDWHDHLYVFERK